MLGSLPLAARAQTTPCVSCDIAEQNAAIAAATNRAIVQQQLQADLQNRRQLQQTMLQNQQLLNTLRLQSSLDANDWAIRQILLQQQINLLRLEAAERAAKLKAKKPHRWLAACGPRPSTRLRGRIKDAPLTHDTGVLRRSTRGTTTDMPTSRGLRGFSRLTYHARHDILNG